MKSKSKLFTDLGELGYPEIAENKLESKMIANETYGKKSCIYIWLTTEQEARQVKRQLSARGHKINSYAVETAIEVQVTFFKGWHWDE